MCSFFLLSSVLLRDPMEWGDLELLFRFEVPRF